MISLIFNLFKFIFVAIAFVSVTAIKIALIAVVLFVVCPDTAFFLETVIIPLIK